MSTTLSGLKLGTHANGTSDIDITSLNFGRSDLDDAHRTVAITNPYFEWVYAGTAAAGDRQVVGMRLGFGGIAGDVGLAMNTVSGSLALDHAGGPGDVARLAADRAGRLPGACALALNQIGGVTAGTADGASRDFFLSVLKSAVAYPTANAALGAPRPRPRPASGSIGPIAWPRSTPPAPRRPTCPRSGHDADRHRQHGTVGHRDAMLRSCAAS